MWNVLVVVLLFIAYPADGALTGAANDEEEEEEEEDDDDDDDDDEGYACSSVWVFSVDAMKCGGCWQYSTDAYDLSGAITICGV